ncbi:hypothetical protein FHS57_001655 [Runella defluvii]|uniref:DUF4407 domain-containing protein n=1 Tax=Runella defluvii TaxID=370973 RepID=A0A7W6EPP0_9BACT|nr:DUF4407 domain-containing protein [Runella defluvii]MBB3837658.1 hypothetical protein [Runella defluvii]
MKKNEEVHYSKIQYIFWVIAGSEISALKKCPNDYNRHANIGLMIFITSLFAGLMGYIAGKTFVKDNEIGVIGFALVWAFLIFSLDRSMVNSIKKDPTITDFRILPYFVPRFILAIILSFFMSIPLDHIVFHEKIKFEMDKNNAQNWLKRQADLSVGYNIKADTLQVARLEKETEKLEDMINKGCDLCPVAEYKNLKNQINDINRKELPGLLNKKQIADKNYNSYYKIWKNRQSQADATPQDFKSDSKLTSLNTAKRKAAGDYGRKLGEISSLASQANRICNDWLEETKVSKAKKDSSLAVTQSKVRANQDSIKKQSDGYKGMIESMQGFDTQFTTLFLMPNAGVQVLKWLIFLALLVIEILPTYLKLKTPVGQYDWEMYKLEKVTEMEAKVKIKLLEDELQKIESYRSEKEIQLNKNLIDKVTDIEEALANEMLVEWEKKARVEMIKNI